MAGPAEQKRAEDTAKDELKTLEKLNAVPQQPRRRVGPRSTRAAQRSDKVIQAQTQNLVVHASQKSEISRVQHVDKLVEFLETPTGVQRQVLTVEASQVQYIDKVTSTSSVEQRQIPVVQALQKTEAPRVHVVEKTVETPQLQIVEKIVEISDFQTVQHTQTSESLGTALVRSGIGGCDRVRSAFSPTFRCQARGYIRGATRAAVAEGTRRCTAAGSFGGGGGNARRFETTGAASSSLEETSDSAGALRGHG